MAESLELHQSHCNMPSGALGILVRFAPWQVECFEFEMEPLNGLDAKYSVLHQSLQSLDGRM
jgi:hypothetical protein